jgi:hypothetical protein
MIMGGAVQLLAFDAVGIDVIRTASITLAVLVVALLLASARYAFPHIARSDDIVFEAALGLDRISALTFYELYRERRPKNVAAAWFFAVLFGPIGAFAYLRAWPKFTAALLTLNGLGAWWLESWFSVPQLVTIENARIAREAVELVPAVLERRARAQ